MNLVPDANVITVLADEDFSKRCDEPCPVEFGTRVRMLEYGTTGTVVGGSGGCLFVKQEDGEEITVLLYGDRKIEVLTQAF